MTLASRALALVMVLTRNGEKGIAVGQGAGEGAPVGAPLGEKTQCRILMAAGEIGERGEQFVAHRHGLFGGGGWRRGAQVRGKIDQRDIGLMADGGDQRDHAFRRRPDHNLLVE